MGEDQKANEPEQAEQSEDVNANTTEYESSGNEEYVGNEVVDTNAGEEASDGGVAEVDDEEVRKTL